MQSNRTGDVSLVCYNRYSDSKGVYVAYELRDISGKTDIWSREQVLRRQGHGYIIQNLKVRNNRILIDESYEVLYNVHVASFKLKDLSEVDRQRVMNAIR